MNTKISDKVFRVLFVFVFLLGTVWIPGTNAGAQEPTPNFTVHPEEDFIGGWWGWPSGTPIAFTVDDPSTPENSDYAGTATVRDNQSFGVHIGEFIDIKPGFMVTVSDSISTKSTTVTNMQITTVDPISDTILGTAEPGSTVVSQACEVSGCKWDGTDVTRTVVADSSGNWMANYSVLGNSGEPVFDILPGANIWHTQTDEDGDTTRIQGTVPDPYCIAHPLEDFVDAMEWPEGASILLTLDDPTTQQSPDYTETQVTSYLPDTPVWDRLARFINGAFDVKPGDVVTLTDGTTTKTHIVIDLKVTDFDVDGDKVSGTTDPLATISHVFVCDDNHCSGRTTVADEFGNWTADFSTPGDTSHPETFDIRPGTEGLAIQFDADGATQISWSVPNPRFTVWFEEDNVTGWEWPENIPITLTIDDPFTTDNPDYSDVQYVSPAPWDPENLTVRFATENNINIQPGFNVTISDGTVSKSMTVDNLTVTEINVENDTIVGTSDPGAQIVMFVCAPSDCGGGIGLRSTVANADGNWSINYQVAENPDEETYDIRPGDRFEISSRMSPDEGGTQVRRSAPEPTITARPWFDNNTVAANNWLAGTLLTLTIDDPATSGQSPDFTATFTAKSDPDGGTWTPFRLGSAYVLKPGDHISITGDGITKTTTVADFRITSVDIENEVVTGTAGPGVSEVDVRISTSPTMMRRYVSVTNGIWTADFSVATPEYGTYDIELGDYVTAYWQDSDGDWTTDIWFPYHTTSHPDEDRVEGYGWPLGTPVNIQVDDPVTPGNPDFSGQTAPDMAVGYAAFNLNFHGQYDLKGGDVVTVSQGGIVKTHTVADIAVTSIDSDADTVSGTTNTAWVNIGILSWRGGVYRAGTVDQDGNWSANFGDPGDTSQDIFDIQPGVMGFATYAEEDEDQTWIGWGDLLDTDGDGTTDVFDRCPDDATDACNVLGSAGATIGADGGRLATVNNKVVLNVPSEALEEYTTLSVTDKGGGYELASDQGPMTVVQSYSLQPNGTSFDPPASITFRWDDADDDGIVDGTTVQEAELVLVKDGIAITTSCGANPGCDMTANELTVEVGSLSLFALAAPANQPPVADAGGPYSGKEGSSVRLNASASTDPDNDIATYAWDLDGDGQFDDATGQKPKYKFADNGNYTISVLVTDAYGLQDTDEATVVIKNVAPVVTSITKPTTSRVSKPMTLRAKFKDAGANDTFTATWKWGDGTSSSGTISGNTVTSVHTYNRPGAYLVTIIVTDDDGGVGKGYTLILVRRR